MLRVFQKVVWNHRDLLVFQGVPYSFQKCRHKVVTPLSEGCETQFDVENDQQGRTFTGSIVEICGHHPVWAPGTSSEGVWTLQSHPPEKVLGALGH